MVVRSVLCGYRLIDGLLWVWFRLDLDGVLLVLGVAEVCVAVWCVCVGFHGYLLGSGFYG